MQDLQDNNVEAGRAEPSVRDARAAGRAPPAAPPRPLLLLGHGLRQAGRHRASRGRREGHRAHYDGPYL